MSAKVRERVAKMATLSHADRMKVIERNIDKFQVHQQEQQKLVDTTAEIGGQIDISKIKLSEVDAHSKAMSEGIAELIIGLDASVASIES